MRMEAAAAAMQPLLAVDGTPVFTINIPPKSMIK